MIDRASPPPFKKSLDFKLPAPEKIYSIGESEVWYLPSSISEAIKIEIVFKAGKYHENKVGEAHFALNLLDKGTSEKSAIEIANIFDYYGAHIDLKVGYDFSILSLYSLRKNLDQLLRVLFTILSSPTFPEEELELLKKIVSENLKVNLEKNEYIASNKIRKQLYGEHPYGMDTKLRDINELNLNHIRNFYSENLKPFKVFIVGNVDQTTISSIVKNLNFAKAAPAKQIKFSDVNPKLEFVEGPSKVQASIRLGTRTINRSHQDWPAIQLLNHILGGYFGSRLMKNIREDKGLTYGIHSTINPFLHSTWIGISAEVNNSNVDLALKEINAELSRLVEIDEEELVMGKNHFIGSLQNDITTIFTASERLKTIILNDLSFDFYQKVINTINELGKDELSRVSSEHFNPILFSSLAVK